MQFHATENLKHRVAIGAFFFLQGIVFSCWASRIPDIKQHLALNDAQLGTALLAIPLGQVCAMWPTGILVSKFGSRTIMTFGTFLYPLALVCIGLSNSLWQLVCGLVFFGLSANMQNISINTQAVDLESVYGRSIMAAFHGMWSLAGVTGGLLTTLLVGSGIGYKSQFAGAFVLAASTLVLCRRHLMPPSFERAKQQGRKIFARPDSLIVIVGFIAFACWCTEGCMFDWSGVYFKNVVRPDPALTRVGFVAFMTAMATGRFLADYLINKFGALKIIFAGGVLIFSGMGAAVAHPSFYVATIGFMMTGFGVSSIIPICYSIAGRSKNLPPSLAIATVSSIGFFGFLICPPLIGYVAYASSLRVSFGLISITGLVLALLSSKVGKLQKN